MTDSLEAIKVLLVEDDPDYSTLVRMHLDACGKRTRIRLEYAATLREAVQYLGTESVDVILLDLMLPDSRGLGTLEAMRTWSGDVPIVVLTNMAGEDIGLEAIAKGAQDFIVKERIEASQLLRAIRFALERHRQREKIEAVVRGVSDGVLVVDGSTRILFANEAATRLLRLPRERIIGSVFPFEIEHPDRELALRDENGIVRTVRLWSGPVEWDAPRARLVTLQDITELRRLEETRAELRQKRREEMRRDMFLSNLSHEMRSPLSVVYSVIKLLMREETGSPEKRQEMLRTALRNGERLVRIVKNLLDLSRLESGRAKPHPRLFAIRPLLEEAVEDGRLVDERSESVRIEIGGNDDEPICAFSDRDMIAQVLSNLVANAVRFAETRVVVEARKRGAEIEISVSDDGPGTLPEERRRIFTRFEQGYRPKTGKYKGTGLGLPICREIVRLNGGRIAVEDGPLGGSRFVFTIPAEGADFPGVSAGGPAASEGREP